jgi:hypothetical protein
MDVTMNAIAVQLEERAEPGHRGFDGNKHSW